MEKIEIQDVTLNKPHRELANDVAMLFSWAKMENTPYRDFSRPRKTPSAPIVEKALADGPAKSEAEPLPATVTSFVAASVPPELGTNGTASVPEAPPPLRTPATPPASGKLAPALAGYAACAGVGQTAPAANLGKALCSLGE